MALAAPARHEVEDKAGPVVAEVLHYINEHYPDELSLDLLSAKFFISKYHLSHEFHRLVGTSVYRYIIQKRLVIAKQMLANGVAPTDVYGHCGFGDYANFTGRSKRNIISARNSFWAGLEMKIHLEVDAKCLL